VCWLRADADVLVAEKGWAGGLVDGDDRAPGLAAVERADGRAMRGLGTTRRVVEPHCVDARVFHQELSTLYGELLESARLKGSGRWGCRHLG